MADLSLPLLLSRLAGELIGLHHMAAEVEATIDEMVEGGAGPLEAKAIRNLQLLDILNQTLLALSACAANTALQASPAWTVDAASAVAGLKLSGIAHRLAGDGGPLTTAEPEGYQLFSDG